MEAHEDQSGTVAQHNSRTIKVTDFSNYVDCNSVAAILFLSNRPFKNAIKIANNSYPRYFKIIIETLS